jgi:hypothetical protein
MPIIIPTKSPPISSMLYHSTKAKMQKRLNARKKSILLLGLPLLAAIATLINYVILSLDGSGFSHDIENPFLTNKKLLASLTTRTEVSAKTTNWRTPWCDQVQKARKGLPSFLHISYPCEEMKPATSAIVCMLTDGASSDEPRKKFVFTAGDYINGVMTLDASLQGNIDPQKTHQLLLLREGFTLEPRDIMRLQAVGWI